MIIEIDTYSKPRRSHIFKREKNDHYVEEPWCSSRLFDVESFDGHIMDPACGWGTIVTNALKHGYCAAGSDIINRGWDSSLTPSNFLLSDHAYDNIVTNPPFDKIQKFTIHAVAHSRCKTAILFPLARLPAARYIERLPLVRIWLLAPRPSMPPGSYIKAGGKVGGGRVDFCWLVFQRGYQGQPTMNWLHRKGIPLFNPQ